MIKLLTVEDNPQMRQLLRSMVSDLVDVVTEGGGGVEAAALYLAEQMSECWERSHRPRS